MNQGNTDLVDPYREEVFYENHTGKLDVEVLRQKLYKLSTSGSSNHESMDENLNDPIEYYEYFMNIAKMFAQKKKNKKHRVSFIKKACQKKRPHKAFM